MLEQRQVWIEGLSSADAVFAYLEETPVLEDAWRQKALKELEAAKSEILARDPNAELSAEDWQALTDRFAGIELRRWRWREHREAPPIPHVISAELAPPEAMRHLLTDFYVDPETHHRIPEEIRAVAEPYWRQLYNNRPHRMGGYHDGLQSDAVIGPSTQFLLFQIATDDAMHWVWGDAGAYYFWIRPEDLEAGDFSKVERWLESH